MMTAKKSLTMIHADRGVSLDLLIFVLLFNFVIVYANRLLLLTAYFTVVAWVFKIVSRCTALSKTGISFLNTRHMHHIRYNRKRERNSKQVKLQGRYGVKAS